MTTTRYFHNPATGLYNVIAADGRFIGGYHHEAEAIEIVQEIEATATPTATLTTAIPRSITYCKETHDYEMKLDGQPVGFARTYHEAEMLLDEMVYDLLSRGLIGEVERDADLVLDPPAVISEPTPATGRREDAAYYEITATYCSMPLRYRLHNEREHGIDCLGAMAGDNAPSWYGTSLTQESLDLPAETIAALRELWESLFRPTPTPTPTTAIPRSIRYDRTTKDYLATVDDNPIGYFPSYHAAEIACDDHTADLLSRGLIGEPDAGSFCPSCGDDLREDVAVCAACQETESPRLTCPQFVALAVREA